MNQTINRLESLVRIIGQSGNPDKDFFYLGGPMTGIPQFNFPRFRKVAAELRARGYNIVSPAELDDPKTEAAAMASHDGAPGSGSTGDEVYEDFLSRDIIVCALPTCVGGIFIEGWHKSRGARGESWVLDYLQKQTLEYFDGGLLVSFDRDQTLEAYGVPVEARGSVPKDRPGLLTANGRPEPARKELV